MSRRRGPIAVPRVVIAILAVQTLTVAALATVLLTRGSGVRVVRVAPQVVTVGGAKGEKPSNPATLASVFRPVADAYVRADSPMSSYGHNAELRVDGSPIARAYLRFSVVGGGRSIERATLKLYSLTRSESGVEVAAVPGGWSESSISFDTAPRPSGHGIPSGPLDENQWADIDVTPLTHTGSELDLALSGLGPKELATKSRESGRLAPELIVRFRARAAQSTPRRLASVRRSSGATLVAAGDIASCASTGDEATAKLIDRIAGTVAVLGDNAYESGNAEEFARCYGPTWGRQKARTRPAIGNHEYLTHGGAGYFGYFGAEAGDSSKGYYSYELGRWHVVVLNSNCGIVLCGNGSPQERWLRGDLRAHRARCTLAYWHHPRFSSGENGDDPGTSAFWRDLYAAGADVVLAGHDHDYERFVPLDPKGRPDAARGIREFVVGTGGKNHTPITRPVRPISAVRNDETFGVLKLTLRPRDYSWRFLPVAGASFRDSGSARCH